MNPSEAVTLRAQMVEAYARYATPQRLDKVSPQTRAMTGLELQALATAELYTWRSDLLTAALSAAITLPGPVTLRQELMPSASGIYMFDEPALFEGTKRAIAAFMWHPFAKDYTAFWLYIRTCGTTWAVMGPLAAYANFILNHDCEILTSKALDIRDLQTESEFHSQKGSDTALRFITASWLWLKQTVMRPQPQLVNSRAKKIADRAGVTSNVNVIVLRRVEDSCKARDEDADQKEYSCQWLVRGHWRQQFYPSTADHRPIWIEPYVKGPEDKPFKASGPTIFAVTR